MKWVFLLFTLCFLSCEILDNKNTTTSGLDANLLTTISDREITVNDFIKRCEYVPRPNYCKNNNYIHKKIALNSLIAEKLLALEFEKSDLSFSSAQNNLITGRKEQSMRQMMLKKNGFDKVKPDSSVINTIAKQIKKTYNISFLIVDPQQKQKIVSENFESLTSIKHKIENAPSINNKQITFNDKMPTVVKEILFFSEPSKNFLYGPISINKINFMFFEIESWNTIVSVTSVQ